MKRTVVSLAVAWLVFLGWMAPALAEPNIEDGARVFSANCIACHIGGGNVVNPSRTLQWNALEKFEMDSMEAITGQVTNGKNGMPAFNGRLTNKQIENVAAYVLSQSQKGW